MHPLDRSQIHNSTAPIFHITHSEGPKSVEATPCLNDCIMQITTLLAWLLSLHSLNQVEALSIELPKRLIYTLSTEYSKSLKLRPLLTNVITASSLCVVSDSISQAFERSKANAISRNATQNDVQTHSWYRSLCMSIYGATVYGWLITYWFKILNHLVPQEGITFALVLKKVTINQFFMSPILNSLFFTYVTATRDINTTLRQKFLQIEKKLKKDLIPTMKRSCVFWGIVQTINFSVISTTYQLLYTNSAFVIWTTYIAFIGFQKLDN